MSALFSALGGFDNKFMGDAVQALKAALEMQKSLSQDYTVPLLISRELEIFKASLSRPT